MPNRSPRVPQIVWYTHARQASCYDLIFARILVLQKSELEKITFKATVAWLSATLSRALPWWSKRRQRSQVALFGIMRIQLTRTHTHTLQDIKTKRTTFFVINFSFLAICEPVCLIYSRDFLFSTLDTIILVHSNCAAVNHALSYAIVTKF